MAACTGSGSLARRAWRTVATWSMFTPSRSMAAGVYPGCLARRRRRGGLLDEVEPRLPRVGLRRRPRGREVQDHVVLLRVRGPQRPSVAVRVTRPRERD